MPPPPPLNAPDALAPGGAPYSPPVLIVPPAAFPIYTGVPLSGTQLFFSSALCQTTLTADNGSSLQLAAILGLPQLYPFKLLLEWGTANQEIVFITQAPTGNGPYTFSNVLRAQDGGGLQITHAAGAQVNHGVSAGDLYQIAPVFNVCYYGADPTGLTDSTAAIQSACNAADNSTAGGVVFLPPGTFKISSTLVFGSAVTMRGAGSWSSVLNQVNGLQNAITVTGSGIQNVLIENLSITGPNSGTGVGIYAACNLSATPVMQLVIRNVLIQSMGSHGVQLITPIITTLDNVQSAFCGGRGFSITGDPLAPTYATSVTMISCYANDCGKDGYYIGTVNYCALTGCASDTNGTGYVIAAGQGVTLSGCGAEVIVAKNGLDGTGFKITQDTSGNKSFGVVLSGCTVRANAAVAFWVTGASKNVILEGIAELSVTGSPTASVKTDAGTMSTLNGYTALTATALTAGTYNEMNDGQTGTSSTAGTAFFSQTQATSAMLYGGSPPASLSFAAGLYADANSTISNVGPSGLVSRLQQSQYAATSAVTVATSAAIASLGSLSVNANDPVAGAKYRVTAHGQFGIVSAAPATTYICDLRWGGTGGTLLTSLSSVATATSPLLPATTALTSVPILIEGEVEFRTATTCEAWLRMTWQNSTTAATAATVSLASTVTAVTVTVTPAQLLSLNWTWGTSNAANTITISASDFERVA
jgi:hypothetical protein